MEVLDRAERPIVLAGGGALWAGVAEEIREVARRLGAPVVTTLNGKGLIDERDLSSLGHARSVRARPALAAADAMLAVGCRFTEVMTGWRRMRVPRDLVQIDLDPAQIGMNHPVAVGIVSDAREALRALIPRLSERVSNAWGDVIERARTARVEKPEWLIDTLRANVPDDTPVFTDACEMGYRMHTDWPSYGPRMFFYPSNYIALGWGFPAALGAAVGLGPGRAVVSVSGDGGFQMTAQELATAARYRLKVIALVHDDGTYGAIKNIQRRDHRGRFLDVDLDLEPGRVDFPRLADAYGVAASRAPDPASLAAALREALDREGPTLVLVPDHWRSFREP